MRIFVIQAALWGALAPMPAGAQLPNPGTPEIARSRQMAERSQLGLVAYCRDQGLANDETVALQRRRVDALPKLEPGGLGEFEETAGRSGMIAFATPQAALEASAKASGITLKSKCEQLALTLQASGN